MIIYEQFILIFYKNFIFYKKNNANIILYLYSIFIFYFFLSLFSLYIQTIWTEIIFMRNYEKENIWRYFVYNYIYIWQIFYTEQLKLTNCQINNI